MDIKKLISSATDFRDAIEQCSRNNLPDTFEEFPCGCCGDTTLLLGTYLKDQGMGAFQYIKGERGVVEKEWHSHAWLQKYNIIVDITADQFLEITDRVIVAQTSDSHWHHSFQQVCTGEAGYCTDGSDEELDKACKVITKKITHSN